MPIQPATSCPSWCDPRLCTTWPSNIQHRSTPIEFSSTRDDRVISVGLDRMDEVGLFEVVGTVAVLLTITDTASVDHAGDDRVLETALSATDARFLMAALGVEVDKFEQLLAVAR